MLLLQSLGTAPKWCSFLDNLTEELEESNAAIGIYKSCLNAVMHKRKKLLYNYIYVTRNWNLIYKILKTIHKQLSVSLHENKLNPKKKDKYLKNTNFNTVSQYLAFVVWAYILCR